jgi:hypothetical protein
MLGVALMMSSASVIALEKTATKAVDQASTDLGAEMKITAFSEGVKAAIAELVSRVNLFDGRIDTLESWRTGVDTSIADILARLAALEARAPHLAYLYDTWRPWVEAQLTSLTGSVSDLNTRVTTLETGGGSGLVYNGTFANNVSGVNHDLCVLWYLYVGTTEDNHNHTCTMGGGPGSFSITASAVKGSTSCRMMCYDFE